VEARFAHAAHGQIELVVGDNIDIQAEHTAVQIAVDVPGAAPAARGAVAVGNDDGDVHQDRDCVACQHVGGYGKEGEQHERLAQVVVVELAGFLRWA
jgi:hypothetical protein